MKGVQCLVLWSLVALVCGMPGLSAATEAPEILDEPELLEMLSDTGGEAHHGTLADELQPEEETPVGTDEAQITSMLYVKLAYGASGCDQGAEITSESECIIALTALKLPTNMWTGSMDSIPRFCSVREAGVKNPWNGGASGHFNSASNGISRADLAPVCKRSRLFGEKTIMVVRIETLDANSKYCDEDCAWKLMFGPELQFGLQPTLDAATREASYGQMWFNKSKSTVVSVKLPVEKFALPCHFGKIGELARNSAKKDHGKDPDSYDFIYHFLPNNMRCPGAGVAFLFGKHAYSAPGGTRNGIIKHEVGHNYGLVHARALGGGKDTQGSPGKEDGYDTGSSMGGGVIFGTAERYMLGWISGDAVQDLGEFRSPNGDLPGNPRLMAYWDAGSCGPKGDDYNWGWCGGDRGICPKTKAVDTDICLSGSAKLHFMSQRDKFHYRGCKFIWFAQYACEGATATTTTTTVPDGFHDFLLKVAAARHPLKTPHGPHTVIFSLWNDAVFALSYRTPHGTDGACSKVMPDRFGWVVNHKVNIHRLHGGRAQGRGFGTQVLYAGVGAGERFTLDKGPVSNSDRGNFTLEVCSADDDQAVVSILFHAGSNRRSKCPPSTTTATTTSGPTSTTSTTVTTTPLITSTSTSSTTFGLGIQSGDTIFLKTRSGKGNHIDVEGNAVQARWDSQGTLQALVIEKKNGGLVSSGDIVFLKSHTGAHIHVNEQDVRAEWNDQGGWQAMRIEKRTGSGPILPDDSICLQAHTGKHLDVEDTIVRARWDDCSEWQAMRIQKEVDGALFSGASIQLLAHTGKRVDVEGTEVRARWADAGSWQTFTIHNFGGRALFSGDAVFLEAHTGKHVDVQGVSVQARWKDFGGHWQKLVIEGAHGSGPIMPSDAIFLRAHTGMMLDVQGETVQATWNDKGAWQRFKIEKASSQAGPRRLTQTSQSVVLV